VDNPVKWELTCKNRAPPPNPPQPLESWEVGIDGASSFGAIRNLAALNPRLEMDRIANTAPSTAVVFPYRTEPGQQGVYQGVLT